MIQSSLWRVRGLEGEQSDKWIGILSFSQTVEGAKYMELSGSVKYFEHTEIPHLKPN